MKALLVISAISWTVFSAQAQTKVGGGLAFGTEILTIGFDVRATFGINENILFAPDITYFLNNTDVVFLGIQTKSKFKWWEINLNGNYVWNLSGFSPYVLTGLNLAIIGSEIELFGSRVSDSDTKVGWNIGGGANLPFNDKLEGFFELKYNIFISDPDQLAIKGGVKVAIK